MKRTYAVMLALAVTVSTTAGAEILGNPGTNVGEKNLFVGVEYSSITNTYDFDTTDLDTRHERAGVKITVGLSDRFDVFIRGGGASVTMDYSSNNYRYHGLGYAVDDFDSDFKASFGAGARLRLFNFVDSGTRVYVEGGGYMVNANGEIRWNQSDGSTFIKKRDMRWVDMYAALGIARRLDYIDLTFGAGFSNIWWQFDDVDITRSGTTESRIPRATRDSFEFDNPVFGFIGLDFLLPLEYRISIQAAVRNLDTAEFGVALSQGLQK